MCTSLAIRNGGFCFGRNMDIEGSFGEQIVIAPRRFPFLCFSGRRVARRYAFVGTAFVSEGYPLYADAMNEQGLCMAGLSFPQNACYHGAGEGFEVPPYDMIPWVLGQCASVAQAAELLAETCVVSRSFSENIALTPLHWHIADSTRSIVVEPLKQGLVLYEDPVDVLTNNPIFPIQLAAADSYAHLSPVSFRGERLSDDGFFSFGEGGVGLPGDFSSRSRFVRAAFLAKHLPPIQKDEERVAAHLQLLASVAPPKGAVRDEKGMSHYTTYSCCMLPERRTYYHKSFDNISPTEVVLTEVLATGEDLVMKTKNPMQKKIKNFKKTIDKYIMM